MQLQRPQPLPTLSRDLQAMKVICPISRSGQPWKPKPHPPLMAIKRTGGVWAGKKAWREVTGIRSLMLPGGKVTYTLYLLCVGTELDSISSEHHNGSMR